MTLPFDTFQALLVWLASAAVAGAVASWLQEHLKGWLPDTSWLSGRVVAIVMAILATAAVYTVQFVFGWPLFPDVPSAPILLSVAVNFILTLVFSQGAYGLVIRQNRNAPPF